MADKRISELTSGNPAQSGDLIPIDRAGSNFSVTAASLALLATGVQFGLTAPSWWGSGDGSQYSFTGGGNGQWGAATANVIKFWTIRLPYRIQVSKLAYYQLSTLASSNAAFGVYSADGQTKIFSWDSIDTHTSGGIKTHSLGASYILEAGMYIVACGCDQNATSNPATQGGYGTAGTNEFVMPWNNNGTVHTGTATNNMSGGAMPSALGVLVNGGTIGVSLPLVTMEP